MRANMKRPLRTVGCVATQKRFRFRLRFEMARGRRAGIDGDEWLVHEDRDTVVWLRTLKADSSLEHANTWVLNGSAYDSVEDALNAGMYWRGTLQRAFAAVSVSADFGDYVARGGGFSAEMLDIIRASTGHLAANETFGVMVFPQDAHVTVHSGAAVGYARTPADKLARALEATRSSNEMTPKEQLAFDLYSAAAFAGERPDAKLILLMMALEALTDARLRDAATRAHIDALIEATDAEEALSPAEAERLKSVLRNLKHEGSRQAAHRLVTAMDGRSYGHRPAADFFRECYNVRSALVHGASRPDRTHVSLLASHLHVLVGHLIAGRDVVEAVDPSAAGAT